MTPVHRARHQQERDLFIWQKIPNCVAKEILERPLHMAKEPSSYSKSDLPHKGETSALYLAAVATNSALELASLHFLAPKHPELIYECVCVFVCACVCVYMFVYTTARSSLPASTSWPQNTQRCKISSCARATPRLRVHVCVCVCVCVCACVCVRACVYERACRHLYTPRCTRNKYLFRYVHNYLNPKPKP